MTHMRERERTGDEEIRALSKQTPLRAESTMTCKRRHFILQMMRLSFVDSSALRPNNKQNETQILNP